MAVAELKEAIRVLRTIPSLWITGIVAGTLAATLWILYNSAGAFFTSKLLIIFGLIFLFFITGSLTVIKRESGNVKDLITGGARSFFRVLLPQMVVIFSLGLVMILAIMTLSFAGITPDPEVLTAFTLAIGIPALLITQFFDTAAVFEDRLVFDSIRRSIDIVTTRFGDVIAFIGVSCGVVMVILFGLMMVWEAFLFDKLEPLSRYNETQIQAITPDQMLAIIGPSGVWVTAGVLFLAGVLLVPVLISYKACFYRSITNSVPTIQQEITGEYDSKGRWYKY